MNFALRNMNETERIDAAQDLFKVTDHDTGKGELHGLCPIHSDKNPSFSYNYKKDQYNCLACSAAGDLVKLYSNINQRCPVKFLHTLIRR